MGGLYTELDFGKSRGPATCAPWGLVYELLGCRWDAGNRRFRDANGIGLGGLGGLVTWGSGLGAGQEGSVGRGLAGPGVRAANLGGNLPRAQHRGIMTLGWLS